MSRPSLLSRFALFLALGAAGACRLPGAAVSAPDAGGARLPGAARVRLSTVWKDWALADVPAPASQDCTAAGGPAAPAFVVGDFDADNHADIAVLVRTGSGPRIAVLLYRLLGYEFFDLGTVDLAAAPLLRIDRPGILYHRKDDPLDHYFPTPTVALYACTGRQAAFIWNGAGFERVMLQ